MPIQKEADAAAGVDSPRRVPRWVLGGLVLLLGCAALGGLIVLGVGLLVRAGIVSMEFIPNGR